MPFPHKLSATVPFHVPAKEVGVGPVMLSLPQATQSKAAITSNAVVRIINTSDCMWVQSDVS